MIWVLVDELLRDAIRQAPMPQVAALGAAGFSAMCAFQLLLLR